jgi:beta-galactosidase
MEMLRPESAEVLAWHNRQVCGSGFAACIGCCMGKDCLKPLLESILRDAGLWGEAQSGHAVHFYFNFSSDSAKRPYYHEDAVDLLAGTECAKGCLLDFEPWGAFVLGEKQRLATDSVCRFTSI